MHVFFLFRLIAVGALLSTVTACALIIIQSLLDHTERSKIYDSIDYSTLDTTSEEFYTHAKSNFSSFMENGNSTCKEWSQTFRVHTNTSIDLPCPVTYPAPTFGGTFKAFASIMFAFAGASTFPTVQADMKQKEKFSKAAYIACISKLLQLTM